MMLRDDTDMSLPCQVYIGLLGELYSKAVQKKNRLYNHYLASTSYRPLDAAGVG